MIEGKTREESIELTAAALGISPAEAELIVAAALGETLDPRKIEHADFSDEDHAAVDEAWAEIRNERIYLNLMINDDILLDEHGNEILQPPAADL